MKYHNLDSYLILDPCVVEHWLSTSINLNSNYLPIFNEEFDIELKNVGPFIFKYSADSLFGKWIMDECIEKDFGILLVCDTDIIEIANHFRQFIRITTPDYILSYFRFYDPRVLRIFLPTCDAGQLREFFGPVTYYFCADDDPAFFLVYSLRYGQLHTERVSVEDALNNPAALTDPAPPAPPAAYSPTPPTPPPGRPVIIIRRK